MKQVTYGGTIQPMNVLCPNKHNMFIDGKGTATLTATCLDQTCEHYRVKFQVADIPVALIPVDEKPA